MSVLGYRIFVNITERAEGIMADEIKHCIHEFDVTSDVLTLTHMKNIIAQCIQFHGADAEINGFRYAKCFTEEV